MILIVYQISLILSRYCKYGNLKQHRRKYQKTPDKTGAFARGFCPKVRREIYDTYQDRKRCYQNAICSYGGKNRESPRRFNRGINKIIMNLVNIIISFTVVFVFAELIKLNSFFQNLLYNPFIATIIALITLLPVIFLFIWASKQNQEQKAAVKATAIFGVGVVFMQWLAPTVGWYGGPATYAPAIMQGLIYGISVMGFAALLLWAYRSLTKKNYSWGLFCYFLILLSIILGTIVGDKFAIERGIITFQNGYTIFTDVLYAIVLVVFPPLIYKIIRR